MVHHALLTNFPQMGHCTLNVWQETRFLSGGIVGMVLIYFPHCGVP